MTATEKTRLYRYARYYGDIVPKARREAIAKDPTSIGACDEDAYISMAIYKAKPRSKDSFDGKPLGKRATRRLLRDLREEFTGVYR